MKIGTASDILGAIGTVGAFGVALWLLRGELVARRLHDEDRRRRDARMVAAWWDDEVGPDGFRVWVAVRNAGETPIYETVILVGPAIQPAPYPEPYGGAVGVHFGMIPPGDTAAKDIPVSSVELDIESEIPDQDGFYRGGWVELVFTDSDGRHWRRTRTGELVPRKSRSITS